MANPGYVRSTDGDNLDDGSTWALANATLVGAMSDQVAGDRVWVSDNHAESSASAQTISMPGTLASPMQILCGDDTAEPPTALATTGSVATTGANAISINGVGYLYGLTFDCGTTSSTASMTICSTDGSYIYADNCNFRIGNSSASSAIICGTNSSAAETTVILRNCGIRFSAAGQSISPRQCRFRWQGGSLLSGGTSPTNLITLHFEQTDMLIESVDLSNASAGINLVSSGANGVGRVVFRNCKLPASWSGTLGSPTAFNTRVELHNCDSADTNYRLWIEDYAGSIKHETTIVRTGGASDGTTTLSWKMASSANAEYPLITLDSQEIVRWNETTASAITVTVETVTDNVTLTDDECWIEVQYLGTSGAPLGSYVSDAKASVVASAANQATSTETWTTTGLTTPVKQKLSVTFTPQEKGFIHAVVKLAKASTTVYVDPELTVA